jgi:hypothetical protein
MCDAGGIPPGRGRLAWNFDTQADGGPRNRAVQDDLEHGCGHFCELGEELAGVEAPGTMTAKYERWQRSA